eukprot:CAMPEP_0184747082 /NCGR_PEP_ID=MMETSP0315-20130426/9478_1 /TAXON_ID=101924 /ORGANISM="Rhodosorus marinus, Strain UTEX LB 2760" /LENGTH=746 /DNA_ID=CAMNT_0027219845 /DNA_START=167 /DNA_END=2407 /DNA_ORIENTATION=+
MDTLAHTIEVSEPSVNFAAEMRQEAMGKFPPLGPPDIVSVKKEHSPSYGKTVEQTYYHCVRGYDVSSEEAVSAYIASLVSAGFRMGSWYQQSSGGRWQIQKVWYRSYCILNKLDIVVTADIPGSVAVCGLNADGNEVEVTQDMWKDSFLSAACRHIRRVGDAPIYPCMKVYDLFADSALEEQMLTYALDLQDKWHLAGTNRAYKHEGDRSEGGCADSHIATTIYDHFASQARFQQAVDFFKDRASKRDPECAVHAARAYIAQGNLEVAVELLEDVLKQLPNSKLASCVMLEALSSRGEFEGAERFYESHKETVVSDSLAVINVAQAMAKAGKFETALTTLNLAEMPTPPLDPLLRELIPAKSSKTTHEYSKEKLADFDAARIIGLRLKEERRPGLDKNLNELPAKMMTETDRAAYDVLVTILEAIGWESVLEVRSKCFIMRDDVEKRWKQIEDQAREAEAGDAGDADADADGGAEEDHQPTVTEEEQNGHDESAGDTPEAGSSMKDAEAEKGKRGTSGEEDLRPVALTSESLAEEEYNELSISSSPGPQPSTANKVSSIEKVTNKRLCQLWLDYLVMTIFEDLRCKREMMAELRDKEAESVPLDTIVKETILTGVDWLRRAQLSRRLRMRNETISCLEISRQLYEKKSKLGLAAHMEWMDFYVSEGEVQSSLQQIASVVDDIYTLLPRTRRIESVNQVRTAVFRLVSKAGLRNVRAAVDDMDEKSSSRINPVLLDAVNWHVHRYDD